MVRPVSRQARPLVASASLLEALSVCRAASAHVPVRGTRKRTPSLPLGQLFRCEEALGTELHDDVLVLVAIADPVAKLISGITGTVSIAEAAEEHSSPKGWVCISAVADDPIGELTSGTHGGPHARIFVPKKPVGEAATVRVSVDGAQADEAVTLGAFIVSVLDAATSRGVLPRFGTPKREPLEGPPRLTGVYGKRDKFARPTGERVHHPKLGDGVVTARIGDGEAEKLVIAFEGGERTVLARFVTRIA
jgi:hypothetical protein